MSEIIIVLFHLSGSLVDTIISAKLSRYFSKLVQKALAFALTQAWRKVFPHSCLHQLPMSMQSASVRIDVEVTMKMEHEKSDY
jgi:hypothetical protein